jgi:hypothetical protein
LSSLGKKTTVLSWPAKDTDRGKQLIRIDGYIRNRLSVGLNDIVDVSKYKDPKEADSHLQELKIHMKHFEEAMKKIRPLSTQELSMYKTIAEQFGKPELTINRRRKERPDANSSSIA